MHVSVLHARVVTGTGGGPDKTILLSPAGLAHTRYRVCAAYLHAPGDPGFPIIEQRARAAGCPLIGVPDRGPFDLTIVGALLRVCRRLDVRVWHAHDYKSNLLGLILRRFHSMRLVTTTHGWVTFSSRTPLYYAVDRWCLPRYDHVVCVSDDLAATVQRLGVARDRTTVLYNGVDTRHFRRRRPSDQAPMRARFGVPSGRPVLGAIGRLSPEKGFPLLLRAAARLATEGLDFEIWIAGEGGEYDRLQDLVCSLGLQNRVRLLGFCESAVDLLHALDGLVLSSLREGLPNVVLEAMAMEVPVVSTRVPGVVGVVEDDCTGLIAPIGDVGRLAAAMRRLITEPPLRLRLAEAGRRRVEECFDLAERMQRECAVYEHVMRGEAF